MQPMGGMGMGYGMGQPMGGGGKGSTLHKGALVLTCAVLALLSSEAPTSWQRR